EHERREVRVEREIVGSAEGLDAGTQGRLVRDRLDPPAVDVDHRAAPAQGFAVVLGAHERHGGPQDLGPRIVATGTGSGGGAGLFGSVHAGVSSASPGPWGGSDRL